MLFMEIDVDQSDYRVRWRICDSLVTALLTVQCQMCSTWNRIHLANGTTHCLGQHINHLVFCHQITMKVPTLNFHFRSVWSGPLTMTPQWPRAQWRGASDVSNPGTVPTDYLARLSVSIVEQRRMGRSSDEW